MIQHFETILPPPGDSQKMLRIYDIGAGPGTATLAFLIWLTCSKQFRSFEGLEFIWTDLNQPIMDDGKKFIVNLLKSGVFGDSNIQIQYHANSLEHIPKQAKPDLVFFGNVLNECTPNEQTQTIRLAKAAEMGGLVVEPALKSASQRVSFFRDTLLTEFESTHILGPCLHDGVCPLKAGKDWCHFSDPISIPGNWFKFFSNELGSERQWMKYSYLCFQNNLGPNKITNQSTSRLVVSDPIRMGPKTKVLLCEPKKVKEYWIDKGQLYRGQIIQPQLNRSKPVGNPTRKGRGADRARR